MIYLLDTDTFIFMIRGLQIGTADNERQRRSKAMARQIFDTGRGKTLIGHEVALSATPWRKWNSAPGTVATTRGRSS